MTSYVIICCYQGPSNNLSTINVTSRRKPRNTKSRSSVNLLSKSPSVPIGYYNHNHHFHLSSSSKSIDCNLQRFPGNSPVPPPTPAITEIFLKLCAAAINSAVPIKVLPIPRRGHWVNMLILTPPTTAMDTQNDGLEKVAPALNMAHVWYLCPISEGGTCLVESFIFSLKMLRTLNMLEIYLFRTKKQTT